VGFAAVLTKPLRPSQLRQTLVNVLTGEKQAALQSVAAPFDAQRGQRKTLRLLMAEDNATNRKLMIHVLSRLGYRADIATTGREVLQCLRRRRYDVILMDVQMPEVDGLEATRQIRAEIPPDQQPHIIAMTANVMKEDRDLCLQAGMDDYLGKPVRVTELVAALERYQPAVAAEAPAADADEALPAAEVVGLDNLRMMTEGDAAFLSGLINTFLKEGPHLVEEIRTAIAQGDAARLRLSAHSLKSNSSNFGAARLEAVSRELELMGKGGTLAAAGPKLAQLEMEYQRVKLALVPYLNA
jgi:CheY-like chemotaxis protein/HPt (histidine-containing phosphotransfer) domain-containing protein